MGKERRREDAAGEAPGLRSHPVPRSQGDWLLVAVLETPRKRQHGPGEGSEYFRDDFPLLSLAWHNYGEMTDPQAVEVSFLWVWGIPFPSDQPAV